MANTTPRVQPVVSDMAERFLAVIASVHGENRQDGGVADARQGAWRGAEELQDPGIWESHSKKKTFNFERTCTRN